MPYFKNNTLQENPPAKIYTSKSRWTSEGNGFENFSALSWPPLTTLSTADTQIPTRLRFLERAPTRKRFPRFTVFECLQAFFGARS